MDGTDINADITHQDIPKPPIKTYKWEDVRRSRKRGAYPWTHLTKPPFDEELDPEEYTMDAFRRSRSTSTLGKSDTQEISEIEELEIKGEMEKPIEEHNGLPEEKENINPATGEAEPTTSKGVVKSLAPAKNNGKESRAKSEEPKKKRKLSIESSYSRVSKFSLSKLGLMDKLKDAKSKIKVPKLPKRSKSDASESNPKKKKVVSTSPDESKATGSWMPLPPNKSPVYIHIPLKLPPGETDEFSQLEFDSRPSSHSGSLTQLQRIGSGRKMSLLGLLTEIKKVHELQKQRRASESKPVSEEESKMETDEEKPKIKVQEKLKSEFETKVDVDDRSSVENEPQIELVESIDSAKSEPKKLDAEKPNIQRKESDRLVITELIDEDRKSTKSTKSTDESKLSKPRTPEPIIHEPEDSSNDDNVSQYLDKDDKCEIVSEKSANISSESISKAGPSQTEGVVRKSPDPEKARKIEATLSKWKKQLPSSPPVSAFKLPTVETQRARAKSEEPKRKRRSSIESSYSRKSLSKLALMKRLKQAKDKIKLPKFPSFTKADKKDSKKSKTKDRSEEENKAEESKKPTEKQKIKGETKKPEVPVYIHIPLKLPPGQTDEFSHLAEESGEPVVVEPEQPKKEEKVEDESSVPTSPDVPGSGVQLIFLTPPSDDEILDASIPETPSETDKKFFEAVKIDDLKNLAKKAVDIVCPEPKKLETVTEDEGSDEQSAPESSQEVTEGKMEVDPSAEEKKSLNQKQQQILVDEEDGLKLSDAAIAMINEEMAKEIKDSETTKELPESTQTKEEKDQDLKSSLKKKVSFKRRSRAEDGERIYEDVQLSNDPAKVSEDPQAKLKPLDSFQSMSVDEEKSYLDKKVIKDTSLEDDYNKWSKSNDHEYEPVNPPPEEMVSRGPPAVHVSDTNQQFHLAEKSADNSERHFVRIPPDEELVVHGDNEMQGLDDNFSTQEAQRRIEDRFFSSTPETTRTSSRTDGELNTSQVDSSALETLPLKKESRQKATTEMKGEKGKGFNETLRAQAGKLKTKLQGIKKPNISLPQRPKFTSSKLKKPEFKKPEFKKPNFKMPKLPESINLPSFSSLTRRESAKDSWRDRQFSTESNAGDSTKKIFDFRTYPRIFDKYRKNKDKASSPSKDDREPTPPPTEFATVPRVGKKKGPVGSLWASKFKDIKHGDQNTRKSKEFDDEGTQDVIRIPLHPDNEDPMDVPSHTRYNEDIDIEDDYDRENRDIHRASPFSRDYLKRWNHGEFHEDPLSHPLQYGQEIDRGDYRVTDLDNDVEETPPGGSFEIGIPHPKEENSSGSLSEHRRGVLEEIDSDEFFLREKGISQDNIEVGKYLSSEIREAFRNPVNALSQLQSEDREYDLDVSDQSEPLQDTPRRKPLRKPKRKKTPHVSSEKVSYDRESVTEPEEYPKPFDEFKFAPPARPKRKSKKGKKKKTAADDLVPYQETIPVAEQFRPETDQMVELVERSSFVPGNILEENPVLLYDKGYPQMYENEHMRGIEQPDIKISDPYYRYENFQRDIDTFLDDNEPNGVPTAPTRKHRSLRSLNASEPDSIIEEIKMSKEIPQQDVAAFRAEQEYIIPTPEPPKRLRRTRSRTQSQSGASQQEDDRTSRGADSLISDTPVEIVEEPCVVDLRDSMGYAVIDKSRLKREPPLPPTRFPSTPPPRTKRSKKSTPKLDKFSTVPRSVNDGPPVRPLRNYSTLGGSSRTSRTSRSKSPTSLQGEEKENFDLGQYIEIEEGEPVRHLQSGDIIQKMRDRPLPAPPRPPRRPRMPAREVFRDISHERNIPPDFGFDKTQEEIEISTQTEPVPEEYLSEELPPTDVLRDIEQQILAFDHEETITHGSLVVQPINNAQILPYNQLHKSQQPTSQPPSERTIPVTREFTIGDQPLRYEQKAYDDEETSEIPEEFTKLKNPPPKAAPRRDQKPYDATEETSEIPEEFTKLKNPPPRPPPPSEEKMQQQSNQEVGMLKAQKMQVLDLDVDKLRVNELQANKIIVSELDGVSLHVAEINSKAGNLVVSGIELSPHLIQEMLDKLQSSVHEQASLVTNPSVSPQSSETQTVKPESIPDSANQTHEKVADIEQKKTSTEDDLPVDSIITEEAPPVPPRYDSKTDLLGENLEELKELELENPEANDLPLQECQEENMLAPPVRPPRKSSQSEKTIQNLEELDEQQPQLESQVPLQKEPETSEFQTDSQDPRKPPSELEVLPIYLPESSDSLPPADNTSKSEDEPPPRPPQPITQQDYVPSQPPASFYALKSVPFADFVEEDIPMAPRRKRHHKAPPVSRSSSDDVPPTPRRHHRSPEPSIPHLSGQLVRACATEMDRSIKRLISHITNNVFRNADGKQDLHVMILILLILIAGLILLSGDDKVTIHHHHWEFFNPPKDL